MTEATLSFAQAHRYDDTQKLLLQAARYPDIDMPAAVTQIEGRRAAEQKLPSWAANDRLLFPPRLSMEQCSSEATARYKAAIAHRIAAEQRSRNASLLATAAAQPSTGASPLVMADLTGGFGVDFSFLSPAFDRSIYIEQNAALCETARHNFAVLGLQNAECMNGDSLRLLPSLPPLTLLYLDPARRSQTGRKVVALSDCEPNVPQCLELLLQKSASILLKCSPMLDISVALSELRQVAEIHVVSVRNECKELLFLLRGTVGVNAAVPSEVLPSPSEPRCYCCDIDAQGVAHTFSYTLDEERAAVCTYTNDICRWLYEPSAALLKAGCRRLPAQRYGLQKLHPDSHLYTSDTLCTDFPGRIFEVEAESGFGKQELKTLLADVPKGNLTLRNFPESTEALRRRLRLAEGGDLYFFATTVKNGSHRLIRCHKVQDKA